MEAGRTFSPPDWMTDERTLSVMRALGGDEVPAKALFVGGCIRNLLLGRAVSDIDIATVHRPDVVMKLLTGAGIRAIPTGMEHGTVTAVIDGMGFQITTLRRDVETDGRHAVIAFTDQWEEDAQRRDFTINTLLASQTGDVFDPTGMGLSDLDLRRVVFVGEASQRIAEDNLRILRFFRFYGQYGEGAPDADALEACRLHAETVWTLSKERITQEFLKILMVPDAAGILALMFDHGVMADFSQRSYSRAHMERLAALQGRYESENLMARLFLLCGPENGCDEWLVLSNMQKQKIELIQQASAAMKHDKKKIRELVYRFGNDATLQSYFIDLALHDRNPDLEIIDIARYWQAPNFGITGKDLMDKGVRAGPELGKKLKALEEKWIKSDFKKIPKI